MGLPQATVTSEHSWSKHSFGHTPSAELHLSGSNFQMVETLEKVCIHVLVHSGRCAPAFTSSFTQICNHMHLLPAHTITHTQSMFANRARTSTEQKT